MIRKDLLSLPVEFVRILQQGQPPLSIATAAAAAARLPSGLQLFVVCAIAVRVCWLQRRWYEDYDGDVPHALCDYCVQVSCVSLGSTGVRDQSRTLPLAAWKPLGPYDPGIIKIKR